MFLVWSHGWPIYTRFDLCTCWYTRFNFRTCVTHDLILYVLLHTWYCACWSPRYDFVRVFTHDLIFVRDVSPNLILYVLLRTIWFLYLIFVRAFTGTHDLIYIRDFTHDLIYVRGFTRFDFVRVVTHDLILCRIHHMIIVRVTHDWLLYVFAHCTGHIHLRLDKLIFITAMDICHWFDVLDFIFNKLDW